MERVLERIKSSTLRKSTAKNYHIIWTKFNKFIIQLDKIPKTWERRVALFCASMVDRGIQSATIKSYVSAIKKTLKLDGYEWNDNLILLEALVKACRLLNDTVKTRLPIQIGLLELILFEVQRIFTQGYIISLYQALFAMAYYGLMRISELATGTEGNHYIRAKDVHVGSNKNKILLVLYTSKTHGKESYPQQIKITAIPNEDVRRKKHFCPFKLLNDYMARRGDYDDLDEPFFIFGGKLPVKAAQVRKVLKICVGRLNLNPDLYDCQSFRSGMASDMARNNFSVSRIKEIGRWKSNAVYKYIKEL